MNKIVDRLRIASRYDHSQGRMMNESADIIEKLKRENVELKEKLDVQTKRGDLASPAMDTAYDFKHLYDEACKERDELAAHVERIKTHADAVVFGADKERLHSGKTVYIIPFEHIESFANTVNQSPKTILAEHDAEVMAKSIEDFADSFNGDKSEWVTYQAFKSSAYQYANKIRNSNGGE